MRVFVTGATGFIGFAIVKELIDAGHQVTGLARSEAAAKKLIHAGAKAHRGSIQDLDGLRTAASSADGAIHTAFYHQMSQIPFGKRLEVLFGGAPSGIVQRYLTAAVEADRCAIQTIGEALSQSGSDRPFAATFATLALKSGQLGTEDQPHDPSFFGAARAESENILQQFARQGLRTSAIRLPPIVHGAGDHGFAPMLIKTARKKKESAYIGNGQNRWPSVHRLDAARLFRLALEKGPAGGTWHGVAEEGIPFKTIAALIGRSLNVPVVSKSLSEAAKQFSFLAPFIPIDNPTSSTFTQQQLGWHPTQTGLLCDLEQADYFQA